MENPISITTLNDFIFCPASIYFHSLESDTDKLMYQESSQLNGTAAHEKSDTGKYSTRKSVLQGISVYSEKYNLIGKIDIFDSEKRILTERKNKIKVVYDGYIFQLYAQYFALKEMGYIVKEIQLYSISDNKKYPIFLPEDDPEMFKQFEANIENVKSFSLETFSQDNPEKCRHCIYYPLCSYSLL